MTLDDAFSKAVEAAIWLKPSDEAAVALLEKVLGEIDRPDRKASPVMILKAIRLLDQLGMTPTARKRLGVWEDADRDSFADVLRIVKSKTGSDSV